MHIDQLIEQAVRATGHGETMVIQDSWTQGRTVFGGASAALLYTALQSRVIPGRCLRSLTTNFVGPLLADVPFNFEVELLREGKNASQVIGRIVQDGQVAVVQQGCFGTDRESAIEVKNYDNHGMLKPEQLPKLPVVEKITPNFIRHMELSVASGALPYSSSKGSHIHGWMRFKQPPVKITDAHLICLIDVWPLAVVQMMDSFSPGSTMSWNLEFIHPHQPVMPDEWFAYQVKTRQAAAGYGHTEANVWDAAGELVAISRQTIAVFD